MASRRRARVLLAVLAAVLMCAGAALLMLPVVQDWRYAHEAGDTIRVATSTYDALDNPERLECLRQARAYNARLAGEPSDEMADEMADVQLWDYSWQLTWQGTPESMMAWIDIPRVATKLPIYHGTSDAALMAGVGHVEWSALPVGGEGTRCVLTAHSGMDRTRMFDDIRTLEQGDVFVIWALGEPYAYRVVGQQVVLPDEVDGLAGVPGRDLCTLVTCEPFGVNTHRLLVTGERCAYEPDAAQTAGADAYVNRRTAPPLAAAGVLAVAVVAEAIVAVRRLRNGKQSINGEEEGAGHAGKHA